MKRLATATAIVVATLLAVGVAWRLRGVVLIFFMSLATAAAMRPLAEWLCRRHIHWTAALGIAYLSVGSFLCLLIAASAGPVSADIERVSDDFTLVYQRLVTEWPNGTSVQRAAAKYLPAFDGAGSQPTIAQFGSRLVGLTLSVVETIINITLVVVLSIYWSFDRVYFERLWLSLLPVDRRGPARDIWQGVERETGAYLRSEIVQCAAAGLMLNAGYSLLGFPYPALLALVGAIAWLVPWIGALVAVAAVLAASVLAAALPGGPSLVGLALPASLWTIAVLSFLEFVVEPYLFDRKRYNAILVVVLLIGLTDWLGLIGMLLGPPLAAALQILGSEILAYRQQAAIDRAEPVRSLDERLSQLRANVTAIGEPRPEVNSLLDRLGALLEEAKTVPSVDATASTVAS
jgi:predicted PurR-regulated permease PerM